MAKSTSLKVASSGGWREIGITEAIATNQRNGRCVECDEAVRVHRAANNGMAAHVEHLRRNANCSLSDARATLNGAVGGSRTSRETHVGSAPHRSTASPIVAPAVTPDDLARWR